MGHEALTLMTYISCHIIQYNKIIKVSLRSQDCTKWLH